MELIEEVDGINNLLHITELLSSLKENTNNLVDNNLLTENIYLNIY